MRRLFAVICLLAYSPVAFGLVWIQPSRLAPSGTAPTPDLLWYKFNEGSGSTVTNELGTGGTTTNSPTWTSSTQNGSGYAIRFDGQGGGSAKYVTPAAINFASATAITISLWTKRNANSGLQVFFEHTAQWDSNPPSFIGVVDSNELYVGMRDSGGGARQEKCAIGSGSWTHIAMVLDQAANSGVGDVKIYINGTLQSTTITSNTKTSSASFNTDTVYIGGRSGGVFGYDGDVDDFQIISGEVSAANIAAIYAGGSH